MGGVCVACNAPVEEEGKDNCPNCESHGGDMGGAEAPAEMPAEGGNAPAPEMPAAE